MFAGADLVLHLTEWPLYRQLDPAEYAETWLRDGGTTAERDPDAWARGYAAWLEDLADEHKMDVWVFGPLSSDATPLRVPVGHDEAAARDLAAQVWPSWYVETTGSGQIPVVAELDTSAAQLAGGPVGVMYAASWMYQSSNASVPSGGPIAPHTVAFLVDGTKYVVKSADCKWQKNTKKP